MSSLTRWITSLTSTGTSLAWVSPLTTGEYDRVRGGSCLLALGTRGFGLQLCGGFGVNGRRNDILPQGQTSLHQAGMMRHSALGHVAAQSGKREKTGSSWATSVKCLLAGGTHLHTCMWLP